MWSQGHCHSADHNVNWNYYFQCFLGYKNLDHGFENKTICSNLGPFQYRYAVPQYRSAKFTVVDYTFINRTVLRAVVASVHKCCSDRTAVVRVMWSNLVCWRQGNWEAPSRRPYGTLMVVETATRSPGRCSNVTVINIVRRPCNYHRSAVRFSEHPRKNKKHGSLHGHRSTTGRWPCAYGVAVSEKKLN